MTDDPNDPPIYKPTQVAREFGVNGRTVERWIHQAKLKPDVWTIGGHARFKRSTLDRAKEELRKANEWPRVQPGQPDAWMLAPEELEYPKSEVLSQREVQQTLVAFRNERNTGLIPKGLYEADERRKRALIRQAVKVKKAQRKKERLDWLQQRLGMTPRELHRAVFKTPVSTLAAQFGLSGQGLRKICLSFGVEPPRRGYWAKKYARHQQGE